jgi:hypothetical protein
MEEIDLTKLWYQPNLDIFLNRWFANYEAARASLDREGGFLFPYQKHYFVCQPEVVAALGLDPNDLDWEKIGYDCARPNDGEAYQRLHQKRVQIVRDALRESVS